MYYLYAAIFGALGAVTRYWVSFTLPSEGFPYNTLFVNMIGCFLLAIIVKYLKTMPKISYTLLSGIGTGFIGSFTTFSAFSVETVELIIKEDYLSATCYVGASVVGGILFASLGFYVSNRFIDRRCLKSNGN